jgi:hypothetical protein
MSQDVDARGNGGARGQRMHGERHTTKPYVGQWWIWFVAVPALGTLGWYFGWDAPTWVIWRGHIEIPLGPNDDNARVLMGWMTMLAGVALAGISVLIGLGHTRRIATGPTERAGLAFVVLHVAVSWVFGAILACLIMTFGWSLIMLIIIMTGGAVGAFGWNMYRTDPFRADAKGGDGKGEDGLAKLTNIPNAKIVGAIEEDDHFITAHIDPGMGKTRADVDKALDAIEQQVKPAISGNARTELDPVTKLVKTIFMKKDPLTPWPLWRGPSHPGGSFAEGADVGTYEDGQPEVIHLAEWVTEAEAKRAAKVGEQPERVPASGLVSVGMTRSGKSGHGRVIWTDLVFTRRDAGLIYLDGAKPGQSLAGQIMSDITLFATKDGDSIAPMMGLLKALSRLVKYRSDVMGAAGHTGDWSHQTYLDTGLAALLVVVDEGDLIAGTKAFRDLVTKCLSVGIFFHLLIPRMDGDSLDTTARTAIGQTLCYGTGDDYSHLMALLKSTVAAGAGIVQDWRNTKPGYHIYDAVGGVDERRWPMKVRSGRAEVPVLKAHITEGRRYRANQGRVLTPGEIKVLGADWTRYAPPGGRFYEAASPAQTQTPVAPQPAITDGERGKTVLTTSDPYEDTDWKQEDPDAEIPVPAMDRADVEPGDDDYYSQADRAGTPTYHDQGDADEDIPFTPEGEAKPMPPSREAARAEYDATIARLAARGGETTTADIIAEYRYRASSGWFSERTWELERGERTHPQGYRVISVGRGKWTIAEPISNQTPTESVPEPDHTG